jgi:alginate O-acetyltransferase complex protein AlgI
VLLFCLIAFGLAGIAANYFTGSRLYVALLLSAGSIAIISPASLVFCFLLAGMNFVFLKKIAGKNILLFISVLLNIVTLVFFHLYENVRAEYSWAGIPVLLGVSYLTLQFIDHSCRIYYKQAHSPQNFLCYIAAVLYLPKFFSGPIASLSAIERELQQPKENNSTAAYGINRILLGLFKKLVLAESLAPIVHSVFDFNDGYPGLTVLAATLLYAMQLYFDFSGYSDIAIGISSLWKIELPENFNFPFRQKSWGAFWKSWHSSLTNWLWQYVFNPVYLYLSRKNSNKIVTYTASSVLVFTCMALFNGLRAGFFISAAVFAFFYLVEVMFNARKNFLSGVLVFIFFSAGLLYFRNTESRQFALLTQQLLDAGNFLPAEWLRLFFAPLASGGTQQDYFNLSVTIILALGFLLFERKIFNLFSGKKINYIACFVLVILLFTWGVFSNGERFIYMQF